MIVAFGAQVIANFHDNSQALQDTERALRVSPIHIEESRDVLRYVLPPLGLTVLRSESL